MLRRIVLAAAVPLAMCAASIAGTLPRPAPTSFAIHLTNGQQVSLNQFSGKAIAVIFILTYCPHCQKAVNTLVKAQTEYGPRGFQVLASAIEDHAASAVPDFLKRFHPPFPVGYNDRSAALEFLQHPMAARLIMPQLVFIDPTGTIRAQYAGEDAFFDDQQETHVRAKVEEMLAAVASHKKK